MSDRLEDYEQHASLMAAIVAAPDDDLPRLVYADWLDEIGRSEHAEWLRHELVEPTIRTYPEGAAVVVQVCENPLDKTIYFSDWLSDPDVMQFEVAPAVQRVSWETCRGFPSTITVYGVPFAAMVEELKCKYPIVRVKIGVHNRWTNLGQAQLFDAHARSLVVSENFYSPSLSRDQIDAMAYAQWCQLGDRLKSAVNVDYLRTPPAEGEDGQR